MNPVKFKLIKRESVFTKHLAELDVEKKNNFSLRDSCTLFVYLQIQTPSAIMINYYCTEDKISYSKYNESQLM